MGAIGAWWSMGPSVRVRIAGVLVRCHAATPVTLLIVLHGFDPTHSSGRYARVAVPLIGTGVVLAVLLVHELARLLVYARVGVRTRRIDLLIAGGAARLTDEVNRPAADSLAAAAIAVAGLSAGIAELVRARGISSTVLDDTVTALAPVLLAIFLIQFLPAAPFDGGKLLRALVWAIGEKRLWGTKAAALYGQVLSAGFIAGGGLLLTAGDRWSYWGFAGMVLGGQMLIAALDALRDELVLQTAGERSLAQLALPAAPEIAAGTAVADAAMRLIGTPNTGRLLVADGAGAAIGAVGMRDLRRLPRRAWEARTVADLAIPLARLPSAEPGSSALATLRLLEQTDDAVVLVTDAGGKPVTLLDEAGLRSLLLSRATRHADDDGLATPATRR